MAGIVAWKNTRLTGKPKSVASFGSLSRGTIITHGKMQFPKVKKANVGAALSNINRPMINIPPNLQKPYGTLKFTTTNSSSNKKHETHLNFFTFRLPFGTRSFVVEQTPPNNNNNSSQSDGKPQENKVEDNSSYIWKILPPMASYSGHRLWKYSGVSKQSIGKDLMQRFRYSKSDSRRRYRVNFDSLLVLFQFFTIGTTGIAIIATTAIFSLLLLFANTFDLDDYITRFVSDTLTNSTGIIITYESAKGSLWDEKIIKLKKVHIVRAPPKENENHSAMDLTIEELGVKLSGLSWIEGKGFIEEVRMRGVRGFVDRSTEKYDPNWKPIKKKWRRGDFDLDKVVAHDALIKYTPPDPAQRPLDVSIFLLECGRLRKQWLLYDLLCSETIVGMIDDCLFKYAPIQTSSPMLNPTAYPFRMMQFKLDGLKTDIISKNASGPLGWIKEGLLDFDIKVMVPQHTFQEKKDSTYYPLEMLHDSRAHYLDSIKRENEEYANVVKQYQLEQSAYEIQMDWNLKLKRIKLNPPIFSPDMSYVTNAVIHPITAYMNVHSNHIDLNFIMNLPVSEFDGAWTPGAAGLWTALSASVFNSLTEAINTTKKQTDFKTIVRYVYKYFFEKGSEEALKISPPNQEESDSSNDTNTPRVSPSSLQLAPQ